MGNITITNKANYSNNIYFEGVINNKRFTCQLYTVSYFDHTVTGKNLTNDEMTQILKTCLNKI